MRSGVTGGGEEVKFSLRDNHPLTFEPVRIKVKPDPGSIRAGFSVVSPKRLDYPFFMKFLVYFTPIALLGFTTLAFADATQWRETTLRHDRISIALPGEPQKKVTTESSLVGDVTSEIYVVHVGDEGSITVDCSHLPGAALVFAGADTIYDNAKGKLMSRVHGKPVSWKPASLDGVNGMRLTYQTPPMNGSRGYQGAAEFYLVGDELYIIDVMDKTGSNLDLRKKVFDSLHFKKSS